MSTDEKLNPSGPEVTVNPAPIKGSVEQESLDFAQGDIAKMGVDVQAAKNDKALGLLSTHHVAFDPNSSEAKRVLRKIDMRILPMIFAIYLLQIMDKNSLAFSAIMGIRVDANLTASQYSWLGSIVYFGYIAGEIPATFMMQRFPLAKFLAVACFIWGVVVAMHAVCHNFAGLAAVRFLLGFMEVCTAPGAIYITSSWYTKKEQVPRVGIWYMSSQVAQIVGGFLSWAIYQSPRFRWQGLFVLYGCLTAGLGVILFLFLAASPTDAKWLTDDEKTIALERVRENRSGTEVWRFNKTQLWESFRDVRFWLIFMLLISTGLPSGGITAFGPTIINSFGFNTNQSLLLNMGSGSAAVVGCFIALAVARFTNRTVAGVYVLLLSCVGVIMMFVIHPSNYGARYGGYILTTQFPICVIFIIAFMTAGVGGSTKKFAFGVAYQLGYAVGNIIGPQTFRESDAPNYYVAKYTMLAFLIFSAILIGLIGLLHEIWNMRRDKKDAEDAQNGVHAPHVANEEFIDMTDFQLKSFRYPI